MQVGRGSLPARSGGQRQSLHRQHRSSKIGRAVPVSGCLVTFRSTENTSSVSRGWKKLLEKKPAKKLSERGRKRRGAAAQIVSKTQAMQGIASIGRAAAGPGRVGYAAPALT